MGITDNHIIEIKAIVAEYRRIEKQMANLVEQANLLTQKKQAVELDLTKNRDAEFNLINKIKSETGENPNFAEIVNRINN